MDGLRHGVRTFALLSIALLAGCNPAASPAACTCDLSVSGLEITQAIQTPTNSITLIAQRGTAVRATVVVSGSATAVTGVTGRLHVTVDGTEITPSAGVAPLGGSFTAPLSPQRANETDTLNFELPAPTGIGASSNVTFRVDLTAAVGETNTSNNSFTTPAMTFVARTTPSLFYTAINYTPSGLGLPTAGLIAPGSGDLFVRGILPVNDGDPNLYRQGLFPSLNFGEDANGDGRLDALGTDGSDLLSFLASCRQLIVNNGLGANSNTFLYGWLSGNPIDGNGVAQVGGRNAFGNTEITRGQRSYAHELTHNFGLNHNNRNLDQVGWDVGARLANNWSGNNVTGRVRPTTLFDIQTPGLFSNQAWVDTITYTFLINSPTLASVSRQVAGLSPLFGRLKEPQKNVAVIQGIFDPTGTKLLRLKPVLRLPWASEPASPDQAGDYIAEVIDDAGVTTSVPFTPTIADDPSKGEEHEQPGFFEVMVAVDPARAIDSVRILDRTRQQVFGELKRSEPPTIEIVNPLQGDKLGDKTDVAWKVTDADTPADQLLLQVAYSPNGGESWVPIAVDVPGSASSVSFDSTQIQKSDGRGVIRVFVSDGTSTAFADVTSLTPSAATFPAP